MVNTASALPRKNSRAVQAQKPTPVMDQQTSRAIADVWMNISSTESALADLASMQSGIIMWRAAPTMQSIMAAMAGPVLDKSDRIYCSGFQCYQWQIAAKSDVKSVACQYLGKKFPDRVLSMSVEDIAADLSNPHEGMTKKSMNIVAVHVENDDGWKDVRTLASAATKCECPVLILISSTVPAPRSAMVETLVPNVIDQWHVAADQVQTAIAQVRKSGAIRVIACLDDVSSADVENVNMMASGWA
ncbi:MAG TPA: hypothetical protein VIN59_05380, partial [Alphaproteobacteria bacterium]